MMIYDILAPTLNKVKNIVSEKAPEILLGSGLVSGTVTACFIVKATVNTVDTVNDAHEKRCRIDTDIENEIIPSEVADKEINNVKTYVVKEVVKAWTPVVVGATVTVFSHVGCYKILSDRNQELRNRVKELELWGSSLAYTFGAYRSKIKEKYGEEADDYAMYGLTAPEKTKTSKSKKEEDNIPFAEDTAAPGMSLYAQWYDERSGFFESHVDSDYNIRTINNVARNVNYDLAHGKFLFLNDVYKELDLPRTKLGSIVGWTYDPEKPDKIKIMIKPVKVKDDEGRLMTKLILDFNPDGPINDKVFSRLSQYEKQRLYNVNNRFH